MRWRKMAQNTAVSSKLKAPASLPPSLPTPRKEPPSLRKGVGVLHALGVSGSLTSTPDEVTINLPTYRDRVSHRIGY